MIAWLALKKPLLVAFFIGCTVSFLTSGTLTLRLVGPAMIYWGFVPFIEVAALSAACWKDRRGIPLPRLIDSFFTGYSPWLLWLTGLCAIWTLLSPSSRSLDWTVTT